MSKDTFYFPHDYEPTSDPKIQALLGEYGAVGYGVYWRVVEMLHSNDEHKLPFKDYLFLAIAKQMIASVEQITAIIKYCITPCELFESDSDHFWSNRVNKNIEHRTELSEKRAVAGRAGAIAKQNLANTSKGKKRKVKEIEIYISPDEFYKSQIELSGNDIHYTNFYKFLNGKNELGRPLSGFLGIKEQVTYDQFKKLMEKYNNSTEGRKISDMILSMENDSKYTKGKKSAYLTLNNWVTQRFTK